MRHWLIVLALWMAAPMALSYESWYRATDPGVIEVKEIPAAKLMVAEDLSQRGEPFSRLFRYISKNNVAMTVPVESSMLRNDMRFYVGTKDRQRDLRSEGNVSITEVPARLVVSVGERGGYSSANLTAAETKARQWLDQNPQYRALDEPYAVFWNGPYVPGFLKRFEVHIPVQRVVN
jgi:hypothetical protein